VLCDPRDARVCGGEGEHEVELPAAIAARTWSRLGDGPVPVNPPIGSTSSPSG